MPDAPRPELVAFLHAFGQSSNAYWAQHKPETLADFQARGVGGRTWAEGTAWKDGLTGAEIDAIETENDLNFPPDYRAFLSILNTPNRPAHTFLFQGSELCPAPDQNVFTDWLGDKDAMRRTTDDVRAGIIFDVEENDVWFESWGKCPAGRIKRRETIEGLLAKAPKLIPLHGHRFLVSGFDRISPSPVLSVVRTDAIFYANSIEQCLKMDFLHLCPGLEPEVCTREFGESQFKALTGVPFWGEFLV